MRRNRRAFSLRAALLFVIAAYLTSGGGTSCQKHHHNGSTPRVLSKSRSSSACDCPKFAFTTVRRHMLYLQPNLSRHSHDDLFLSGRTPGGMRLYSLDNLQRRSSAIGAAKRRDTVVDLRSHRTGRVRITHIVSLRWFVAFVCMNGRCAVENREPPSNAARPIPRGLVDCGVTTLRQIRRTSLLNA